jgi:hypothetical protein
MMFFCAIVFLCVAASAEDATIQLMKPFDADGLVGSISLDKQEYAVGESMRVTTTIAIATNKDARRVFNPFFNSLLEMPGRLRVFDSTGKFVAEYLSSRGLSRRGMGEADWVFLYPAYFVGTIKEVQPSTGEMSSKRLPPGEYTMQLVLTDTLIKGQPDTIITKPIDKIEWPEDQKLPQLKIIAASEPVLFRITEKHKKLDGQAAD